MPLPKGRLYTIEDIEALPEGTRAELIDGQIYDLAAPSSVHQEISMFLSGTIWNYIQSQKGKCKVFTAPFAVYLNDNERTYVEPDIAVICNKDKLDNKGCHGAPDWIIEIVSSSSIRMDYGIKLFKYRMAGVSEYWIVDPENQTIIVNNFKRDTMEEFTFTEKVKAGIYEDLEIDFGKMGQTE